MASSLILSPGSELGGEAESDLWRGKRKGSRGGPVGGCDVAHKDSKVLAKAPTTRDTGGDSLKKGPQRGYEVVLPNGSEMREGLKCAICAYLLREAMQTEDGQRVCRGCSERKSLEVNPDFAARREVRQLQVACSNTQKGCQWKGKFESLEKHLNDECEYREVQCPSCDKTLMASKIEVHLKKECPFRKIQCKHCKVEIQSKDLKTHNKSCHCFPIKCEACKKEVKRNEMEQHKEESCEKVACVVCDEKVDRASRSKHYSANESVLFDHLQILGKRVKLCEGAVASEMSDKKETSISEADLQEQIPKTSLFQSVLERLAKLEKDKETLEYKLKEQTNLTKSLQDQVNQLTAVKPSMGDVFSPSQTGNNNNMSFTHSLEQQGPNSRLDKLEAKVESLLKSKTSWPSSVPPEALKSEVPMLSKRMDDLEHRVETIGLQQVDLEVQLQASLVSTHNGQFTWRIPDVSRRIRDAVNKRVTSIYSPPFFTSETGYKMCIRVYLNGDGIGEKTHISVFFVLMKGEFDPLLKWPFESRISLMLVDQDNGRNVVETFRPNGQSKSFQRPTTEMNIASGVPKFAPLSLLNNPSYVKNDVMYIKCSVDTSNVVHA